VTGGRELDTPPTERGDIYRRLGVEPIINGRSTFTILGGSLMPPEVLDAMRQAAESFVDLVELQTVVGRRLAQLTRNEAAFVSGGAAAGLFLAAAACMTRDTDDGVLRLADLPRLPREFVIHRAHRIAYTSAIELAGGRLVEVGGPDGTEAAEFEHALHGGPAGVVYVPKAHLSRSVLPLAAVVEIARARAIPVIVDAAAQLPPADNLWRFSEAGADVVLFSGGKALCGPASSGLIVGSARFIERIARNAAPLDRLGRPMKAGKEELIGLLAAVEWYLRQDQAALSRRYEAVVDHFLTWARDRTDVEVTREELGEAGQPTPRALIRLREPGRPRGSRDELLATLRATPPRIDLLPAGDDAFYVAPETLLPGEEQLVRERLAEVLAAQAE
jgi:D-glucosaminate-6-phosphate ammonia-lyase